MQWTIDEAQVQISNYAGLPTRIMSIAEILMI